jgi:signal transduction histidine kinase
MPSKVWLTIYREGDEIILIIKDDGKGFDPSEKTNGVGLMNIKTRASLFNGELTVITAPGGGCEIKVGFNCQKATDN